MGHSESWNIFVIVKMQLVFSLW
uniref:Uncharacterized protein n=1 Tax=Anguilla anguilla TaxID=7936 RepID=A0A0E9QXC3_ANGAN